MISLIDCGVARRPTAAEAGFGGKRLELFRFATAGKRSKTAALFFIDRKNSPRLLALADEVIQ